MKYIKPIILDCTLRDGGYYTNWDFSKDLVETYLITMSDININCVELGFRFLENNGFKGAHAYTTDAYLDSLKIPENLIITVMINASDLIVNDHYSHENFNSLVPVKASKSKVSMVRLACHFHEVFKIKQAVYKLKNMGYLVGINLMQISNQTSEKITGLLEVLNEWPIDVVYFADSLGSLAVNDVKKISSLFIDTLNTNVGIHTHNNLGLALSNTLAAHNDGVKWLDSTVTGMGRGPGNTKTEELYTEISYKFNEEPNFTLLIKLIEKYFLPLQKRYDWGQNIYYYVAGKKGVHPSYVQEMLSDERYTTEDILNVLDKLPENECASFSTNSLSHANYFFDSKVVGSWDPKESFKDRSVLLLGPAESVGKHRDAIEQFIKKNVPIVVTLNTATGINEDLISYRIAFHPIRLMSDAPKYNNFEQQLIAPFSMLSADIKKQLDVTKVLDFGVGVTDSIFKFNQVSCTVPSRLVLAYALAVATSGQASKIFLAGFDGYPAGDPRNTEVDNLFNLYQQQSQSLPVISLTPTIHSGVETRSVYALRI